MPCQREGVLMRFGKVASSSTLGAVVAVLAFGCGPTEVEGLKVAPATPPPPEVSAPLPKEMNKGGGPGSSGNSKRNPGKDPMKH